MVRCAIDHGVNYLDTAYVYPDSERITGRALRDGYRGRTFLATKSPIGNITKHEDFETCLDEELVRLGTDHIDVYLLHNLFPAHWEKVVRYDGLSFLDRMVQKGKIRYKGFSIHSTLAHYEQILGAFDWDMSQLQLNILDEHQQVGVEGLRLAARRGLATVIMEPLRGGTLLRNVPPEAQALADAWPVKRTLAEWCFRWLYNLPEVTVILSGTSSLEQLRENLRSFDHSAPGVMGADELELVAKIAAAYTAKGEVGCTGCRYCMPCPNGVKIPEIFQLYNRYQFSKPHQIDRVVYQRSLVPDGSGADRCVRCGACVQRCPQGLKIPELLRTAHAELNG